jgi:hypothetical protein
MEKIEMKEKQTSPSKQPAKKVRKNKPVNNTGRDRFDLSRRLLGESDYLKTIMDPLNVIGVQVPDDVTLPSLTTQTLQRLQVTTTSDGVAGCSFLVGSLYGAGGGNAADILTTSSRLTALEPLSKLKVTGSPAVPKLKPLQVGDKLARVQEKLAIRDGKILREKVSPVAAVGDYSWAPWDGDDGEKTYATSLSGPFVQGRVVSAELIAFYEGTPLNMQGRGIAVAASRIETFNELNSVGKPAAIPQCTTDDTDSPVTSLVTSPPANATDALAQRMVTDKPLQACRGQMGVRFIPQDGGDRVYFPIYGGGGAPKNAYEQGRLTVVYEGLASGATIEFWVVENWELLPVSTQLNLAQPRPSLHDPIDLAMTSNFLSERPYAAIAPVRVTQGAREGVVTAHHNGPVTSTASSGGGGGVLNSLMDFIEKAIPIGQRVFEAAKPLAPIIATLL